MAKIEFRGQTYNNEFEMPYDVRQAYIREKESRDVKVSPGTRPLTDRCPEVQLDGRQNFGRTAPVGTVG